MRIIPVIDVMNGVAVRAVGGRRHEYRPVESVLTKSTDPLEVAQAMIDATEAKELYVADLDSILDPTRNDEWPARFCDAFPNTMILIDVGIRTEADFRKLNPYRRVPMPILGSLFGWQISERRRNLVPVIGTETVETANGWGTIANEFCPEIAFSVDIRGNDWLGQREPWEAWGIDYRSEVPDIIEAGMQAMGCLYLILLDLGSVGERRGFHPKMEEWLTGIRGKYTGWPRETFIGGGVRNAEDMQRLEAAGADGVLIASALHDGTVKSVRI